MIRASVLTRTMGCWGPCLDQNQCDNPALLLVLVGFKVAQWLEGFGSWGVLGKVVFLPWSALA